ncbi:MAG: polysaccharide deacetylase family protein [Bacteroidetes bacterium]|nr:polysaccharide deacetylase family protein [Bacteroidota bacterium]
MTIFTEYHSSRLSYILDTLFTQAYTLTHNKAQYLDALGEKLNYSHQKICKDEVWIIPHTLLFEKNIIPQKFEIFQWKDVPAFFNTGGDIPFDFLAASFYLVSRYEEYLPYRPDEYGRFPHTASLAFQHRFLNLPLIDFWIQEIFPELPGGTFTFLPTFDIDIAFKYSGKPFLKNLASLLKEYVTGQRPFFSMPKLTDRKNVKDPFDQFDFLEELCRKRLLNPVYFFLFAEKNRRYDKNILPHKMELKNLILEIASNNKTGIHPSWQSGDDPTLLTKEIENLEKLIGQKIITSRQHYIRMTMPLTYRMLLDNGILQDYSMGYGSINGFRASTSKSFFWYDLEKEIKTNLCIFPFCYMDANAIFEQKLNPEEASQELDFYKTIITKTQGQMIGIWHNHFLTEEKEWQPWRKVFVDFIKKS